MTGRESEEAGPHTNIAALNLIMLKGGRGAKIRLVMRELDMASRSNTAEVDMKDEAGIRVSLQNVVLAFAAAVDSANPALANHHAQVAILADYLAAELGLSVEERRHLIWSALLHDVGALSVDQRLGLLELDTLEEDGRHEELGFRLASGFGPFSDAASIIRYHHTRWEGGRGREARGAAVPLGSHILHLADRVAVITGGPHDIFRRVRFIVKRVEERKGRVFKPELVEALRSLAPRKSVWLDATNPARLPFIMRQHGMATIELDLRGLTSLAQMFCNVIDFRSRFTATHSHGVAASVQALARACGLPVVQGRMMKVAGYLHDLGKLVVPPQVLDKTAGLSTDEWTLIKRHPYMTWRILSSIPELQSIGFWASCHHEQINGRGYPFRYAADQLSVECRILAVADVFTALTGEPAIQTSSFTEKSFVDHSRNGKKLRVGSRNWSGSWVRIWMKWIPHGRRRNKVLPKNTTAFGR